MIRKTRGMLAVAGAAAALVFTPNAAHAVTAFSEGFETSPNSFTTYGSTATRSCTVARSGSCSLLLDPASTSTTVGATHTTSLAMNSRATVSFWFRGTTTSGDLDSDFVVRLGSYEARLHLTEGVGGNNSVSLYTTSGSRVSFDSWASANTWYQFSLVFDTVADTVQGVGPNASSTTVSIPSSATTITGLEARAVEWTSTTNTVRYDDVSVDTCTFNLLGVCA